MEKGAKRAFVAALDKEKDFRSEDQETFVNKGMEVLNLLVHTRILKKGGEQWLEKKRAEIEGKPQSQEQN